MKYSKILLLPALGILTAITFFGCGSLDVNDQIQYSGYEQVYTRDHQAVGSAQLKVYTLTKSSQTFTLSGGGYVFTFAGTNPDLGDVNGITYSGTFSGGTAIVSFEIGMHLSYHWNNDTTTFSLFDGSRK